MLLQLFPDINFVTVVSQVSCNPERISILDNRNKNVISEGSREDEMYSCVLLEINRRLETRLATEFGSLFVLCWCHTHRSRGQQSFQDGRPACACHCQVRSSVVC